MAFKDREITKPFPQSIAGEHVQTISSTELLLKSKQDHVKPS